MDYQIYKGDCVELIDKVQNDSVDLILTDPPYAIMYGVSDRYNWDKERLDNQFIFELMKNKLRYKGKGILFSQEPYTSELITGSPCATTPFLYRANWVKDTSGNCLMAKRAMVSKLEDICIFEKKHDFGCQNPLRQYFADVLTYIGYKSGAQVSKRLGHTRADHCFRVSNVSGQKYGSSQFALCTNETYQELIEVFGIDRMDGFKTFDELKAINQAFNSRFKSQFNLWQGNKSKPNVLEYPKDKEKYHPTQKPVALLEDLIKTYTNEGDTVLDFTMGSGSTGVACMNTGRNFIGIERDDKYFEIARNRIEKAKQEYKG